MIDYVLIEETKISQFFPIAYICHVNKCVLLSCYWYLSTPCENIKKRLVLGV